MDLDALFTYNYRDLCDRPDLQDAIGEIVKNAIKNRREDIIRLICRDDSNRKYKHDVYLFAYQHFYKTVESDNIEDVQFLLDSRVPEYLKYQDSIRTHNADLLIFHAKSVKMLEFFFSNGDTPNAYFEGRTLISSIVGRMLPLTKRSEFTPRLTREEGISLLTYLLPLISTIEFNECSFTHLMTSVLSNDDDEILKLLTPKLGNLNRYFLPLAHGGRAYTFLHYSVNCESIKCVKYLLEKGCDPKIQARGAVGGTLEPPFDRADTSAKHLYSDDHPINLLFNSLETF